MAVRNHSLATVSVMQPRLVFVIVVSGSGGSAVAGGGANTTVVEDYMPHLLQTWCWVPCNRDVPFLLNSIKINLCPQRPRISNIF